MGKFKGNKVWLQARLVWANQERYPSIDKSSTTPRKKYSNDVFHIQRQHSENKIITQSGMFENEVRLGLF